jgi:hypothetical protein
MNVAWPRKFVQDEIRLRACTVMFNVGALKVI